MKNENQNLIRIRSLLQKNGMIRGGDVELTIIPLAGDGSSRKFWRIQEGARGLCLAVAPPVVDKPNLAEARAAREIGLHLLKQGVRVPEQYGWHGETGLLLFEDLGDVKLHDHVVTCRETDDYLGAIRSDYQEVVKSLVLMQIQGARDFDIQWCWDTPKYDKTLMLERESGYFLRAFWQELLGEKEPAGLAREFTFLAEKAAAIPSDYFLHRDFQSRNIMLYDGEPCFIDFQGGRLGPLAYDLASLLIDPYVALPFDFQEELLELYLDKVEELLDIDRRTFVEEYLLLAVQRNLQIVGAFAFLTKQRNKLFFKQYLHPATVSLNALLDCELFSEMQILKKTVSSAVKSLKDLS